MNKLFFTLLFLALTAYAQMQERVAIINTMDDYDSISVSALTYLTDRLRETAVNLLPAERFGVMTTESIVAFLGSMENTIRVCKESSCLAELGRQVSADYIAQGRIGRFNDNLTIKVELYSVVSGNLMGSFTGSSKNVSGLLAIIEEKSADLFRKMLVETKPQKKDAPPTVAPADIQALIKKDIDKHKEKIQEESFHLSHGDRMTLYKENENDGGTIAGMMLNVFTLGSGLGSYIQGDIAVGIMHSVALAVGGLYLLIEPNNNKKILTDMGIGIVGVNWFASLFTPVIHQYRYKKALREALNIDDDDIISIAPLIIPKNGQPAVGLAFNVRY